MLNKLLLTTVISAACLLPFHSTAAPVTEISKDDWLGKIKEVAPAMMCTSFTQNKDINKQLIAAKIDYSKCMTLIPASYEKCKTKFYPDIPQTVNKAIAEKWGQSIGECIGTDFALNHFVPDAPSKMQP